MSIEIRLLQPHEAELANDFFNRIYNTSRPLENFKWEFFDGPCGKAIYVVAVDQVEKSRTKIVGIQCAIPLEFIGSNGQVILTAKSEDTLVDPTYRGQKIFERMYQLLFEECAKAGIKYIWGFTPAQKAFERIGFQIPFFAEQALLVLNPLKAYAHLKNLNKSNTALDRLKIFGLCFFSWVKQFQILFTKKSSLKAASLEGKNELFENFYVAENIFTLNQSGDYLNWRIEKNPFQNNYMSWKMTVADKTTADAIINIRKEIGYLEQLYASGDKDLQILIASLIKEFKTRKVAIIRALCFSSNKTLSTQANILANTGFVHLKRGSFFVWKPLTTENLIEPNKLFITRLFTQGNL